MNPLEVLTRVRLLLAAYERWMHRQSLFSAETSRGHGISARDTDAARWDVCGACEYVTPEDAEAEAALEVLWQVIGSEPVADDFTVWTRVSLWHEQPDLTHDDVLAAIDLAIELAGGAA